MEMLGAYSEWIYEHSDLLPKVLSLLFMGLKGEQVAIVSATLALKDITRECQKQIEPYVEQILAACEEGLRPESRLKAKERSRLMCTVGQVLTLLPYEGTLSYLNQLLPPILHNLELSLQCQPGMDNYFPVHNDVISNLNVLSMLFGSLDPDYVKQDASNMAVEVPRRANPIFPVFQQTLPLLANVGLKWIGEETVIESLCECLKKAVVTLLDEVRPLVLSVIDLTTRLYSISYQHPLLDIMKQIITLFGSDAELRGSIIQSFAQMVSQTISVCSTDLKSRTYLVEHFYALSAVLMKKKADIFQVLSANNEPLFRLATSCILLHERPSVKSSTLFLTEFINKSTETRDMELIVKTNGGDLVSNCLLLIGGTCDSPRNVVEFAADVLLVLNQRYFECLTDWFNIVVTNDNYPTEKVRKSDLEAFCRSVLRERKNKRKLKELCCEFSLLCRGLLGTDYALQSTAKF
ncbi:Importin-13 [Halotydeus destructor]|nr:Importin-13 [Halotydeus destructor]